MTEPNTQTNEAEQMLLFDCDERHPNHWSLHWGGMPELVQEDLTSARKLIVHFRSEEDVQAFAELIQQEISARQPSLWFPAMANRVASDKRWQGTK